MRSGLAAYLNIAYLCLIIEIIIDQVSIGLSHTPGWYLCTGVHIYLPLLVFSPFSDDLAVSKCSKSVDENYYYKSQVVLKFLCLY